MTNVFIFHGTYGYPEENWFPWLKNELEKLDFKVFVPQFPTPENQTLEKWFEVLERYKEYINPSTILIGHSVGGTFLLRILEKMKVKASFIVAGSIGIKPIRGYKRDYFFFFKPFNWKKIRQNSEKFFVFHSDNDHIVSIKNSEEICKNLEVNLIRVPNAGHFNSEAGYDKFELLLEKIKKNIENYI